jgi:hypothetical protein
MVGLQVLVLAIGVRIPVPEQNFLQKTSLKLVKFSDVFLLEGAWIRTFYNIILKI